MKETSITIISTNLNKELINNYKDYYLIENNFTYEDILLHKKVLFWCVLDNLNESELEKIFNFMKKNNISFINVTNNLETSLFTSYIMCFDKKRVLIEGNTIEVLKKEKLLKRLGFELPFMVELSLLLKDYGLVDDIYLSKERIAGALWK